MGYERFLFLISAIVICGAYAATSLKVATSSTDAELGRVREKRAFDVNILLRSLLQKSAELSRFKANVTSALTTTSPPPPPLPTRRPLPPMMTTTQRPNPRGRVGFNYGFGPFQKGAYINFNYGDYGDYNIRPRPRPTAAPTTTMSSMTSPSSPPSPQPQSRPLIPSHQLPPQRPPPPVYGKPALRFGNSNFGQLPADDYYDYEDQAPQNGNSGSNDATADIDYQNEQPAQAPPLPPPSPRPSPRTKNERARTRPPANVAKPNRGTQLRNNIIFQYAQPDDTSSDEAARNDGDAGTDTRNNDDNNNTDGDSGMRTLSFNDQINNADRNADTPLPSQESLSSSNLPTAPSQQTQFFHPAPPFRFGFGSFSSPVMPPTGGDAHVISHLPTAAGSFQLRSPFMNFKSNYDGAYPQPTQYVSQAHSNYQ